MVGWLWEEVFLQPRQPSLYLSHHCCSSQMRACNVIGRQTRLATANPRKGTDGVPHHVCWLINRFTLQTNMYGWTVGVQHMHTACMENFSPPFSPACFVVATPNRPNNVLLRSMARCVD